MLTESVLLNSLAVLKNHFCALKVPRVDDRGVFGLKMRVERESLFRDVRIFARLEGDDDGKRLKRCRQVISVVKFGTVLTVELTWMGWARP
jgi:hypothetical protein